MNILRVIIYNCIIHCRNGFYRFLFITFVSSLSFGMRLSFSLFLFAKINFLVDIACNRQVLKKNLNFLQEYFITSFASSGNSSLSTYLVHPGHFFLSSFLILFPCFSSPADKTCHFFITRIIFSLFSFLMKLKFQEVLQKHRTRSFASNATTNIFIECSIPLSDSSIFIFVYGNIKRGEKKTFLRVLKGNLKIRYCFYQSLSLKYLINYNSKNAITSTEVLNRCHIFHFSPSNFLQLKCNVCHTFIITRLSLIPLLRKLRKFFLSLEIYLFCF